MPAASRRAECVRGPPGPVRRLVQVRFGPGNALVPQHRRYVPGTMVLETTWQTGAGWMTVQDFLAVGPVEGEARRPDYRRAPADTGAIGALVRIATCISGRVEVAVNCGPQFNYGTAAAPGAIPATFARSRARPRITPKISRSASAARFVNDSTDGSCSRTARSPRRSARRPR